MAPSISFENVDLDAVYAVYTRYTRPTPCARVNQWGRLACAWARRSTRSPARVAATANQAQTATTRYPPRLPPVSTARPPSIEPSDTPTFRDVLIHASPSVSWEGATVAWTMLFPVVMVGAIAMPVVAMSAPSTTRPGASGRSEAPMASVIRR